jgi:hypothetical protein
VSTEGRAPRPLGSGGHESASGPQQAWAHWLRLPPPQRQQSTQPPVASQRQHALCWRVPELQQAGVQLVVTPSQVTCPGSRIEQSRFTARQLVLALEQLLVLPSGQVTVALQVF